MKIFKNISLLALVIVTFASCDIEDPIESDITYYANLELIGDELILVESGTPFEDPGIIAQIQDEDVPFETNNPVDTDVPGVYTVNYSSVNDDGFAANISRTVIVYENNGTIAGYWLGSSHTGGGNPVLITTTEDPNVFEISDALGGHYEFNAGYGPAYAVPSTITVSGNSVSSPGGSNLFGAWAISGASLSEDQKTITWSATLTAQAFTIPSIKLEKVTP